jgi:hypothetical protein
VEYIFFAACWLDPWWWKGLARRLDNGAPARAATAVAVGVRVIAVADERRINDLSIFGLGEISTRNKNERASDGKDDESLNAKVNRNESESESESGSESKS